MLRFVLILVLTTLVAACKNDQSSSSENTPTMLGLTAGNAVTFSMTPDGDALSLLFDNNQLVWSALEKVTSKEKVSERQVVIATSKADSTMRIYVRGYFKAPKDSARITLIVAGTNIDLTPNIKKENFAFCTDAKFVEQHTPVTVRMNLRQVAGEDSSIAIDSIDIKSLEKNKKLSNAADCADAS